MSLRDAVLELVDAAGLGIGVCNLCQAQDRCNVGPVLVAVHRHVLRRIQVVLPIRHAQAALQENRRISARIVQILSYPQAKQIVGVELCVVQRVNVRPQRAPELARERVAIGDRGDASKEWLQRLQAPPLDRRLVHETRVVITNLARLGAGRGLGRGLLEQRMQSLQSELGNDRAGAVVGPVGRNLRALQPAAARVPEEVIAGHDRGIHATQLRILRGRRDCLRRGDGKQGHQREPTQMTSKHQASFAGQRPSSLREGWLSGRLPSGQ